MERKAIHDPKAPQAIGPYSPALRAGSFLFVSGQIPVDPATGRVVGEDIESQTEQVMRNLKALLEAGGSSLGKVVKTTVFLTDLSDFDRMNATYARFFEGLTPPARSTVQVSRLPMGVRIEIEAIALVQETNHLE
ncbi:MAG: RidA family protein [Deltaproteobacteria bacterium]|nr:RidA family protein [Deltaproteobacteria bacterium]